MAILSGPTKVLNQALSLPQMGVLSLNFAVCFFLCKIVMIILPTRKAVVTGVKPSVQSLLMVSSVD